MKEGRVQFPIYAGIDVIPLFPIISYVALVHGLASFTDSANIYWAWTKCQASALGAETKEALSETISICLQNRDNTGT